MGLITLVWFSFMFDLENISKKVLMASLYAWTRCLYSGHNTLAGRHSING